MNQLDSLRARFQQRQVDNNQQSWSAFENQQYWQLNMTPIGDDVRKQSDFPGWISVLNEKHDVESNHSTTGAEFDIDVLRVRAGIDTPVKHNQNGQWWLGMNFAYSDAKSKIGAVAGDSEVSTQSIHMGISATWHDHEGYYFDTQIQISDYDIDLIAPGTTGGKESIDAQGLTISAELGQRHQINKNFAITPQLQMQHSEVEFDNFTDARGNDVQIEGARGLTGRVGLAIDYGQSQNKYVYAEASLITEFNTKTDVRVSGAELNNETDKWSGELRLGGVYCSRENRFSLFGEVAGNSSLSRSANRHKLSGRVGMRVRF